MQGKMPYVCLSNQLINMHSKNVFKPKNTGSCLVQENKAIPFYDFEHFYQQNMATIVDQVLKKTRLIEFTEADALGIIHYLLEMFRTRKEVEFMDDKKVYMLCASNVWLSSTLRTRYGWNFLCSDFLDTLSRHTF